MADKRLFNDMMDALGLIYDREVSVALKRAYWDDLHGVDDDALQAAVSAHRKDPDRGRFFPKPADLFSKLPRSLAAQHLPADAAWAVVLRSFDERETVVWTAEIERARAAALEVWSIGDKIGARMAFKATYEQILASSPPPPRWHVSVGHDAARAADAVREAVRAGLLPSAQAQRYLPRDAMAPEGRAIAGLLTGKVIDMPQGRDRQAFMDRLRGVQDAIRQTRSPAEISAERRERERAERLAREAAVRQSARDAAGTCEAGEPVEAQA